jgi:hypothetical protein
VAFGLIAPAAAQYAVALVAHRAPQVMLWVAEIRPLPQHADKDIVYHVRRGRRVGEHHQGIPIEAVGEPVVQPADSIGRIVASEPARHLRQRCRRRTAGFLSIEESGRPESNPAGASWDPAY